MTLLDIGCGRRDHDAPERAREMYTDIVNVQGGDARRY